MSSQSSATGEGFLTVGVRAFVRSLPGMNPSMSSERTGITERLEIDVR